MLNYAFVTNVNNFNNSPSETKLITNKNKSTVSVITPAFHIILALETPSFSSFFSTSNVFPFSKDGADEF